MRATPVSQPATAKGHQSPPLPDSGPRPPRRVPAAAPRAALVRYRTRSHRPRPGRKNPYVATDSAARRPSTAWPPRLRPPPARSRLGPRRSRWGQPRRAATPRRRPPTPCPWRKRGGSRATARHSRATEYGPRARVPLGAGPNPARPSFCPRRRPSRCRSRSPAQAPANPGARPALRLSPRRSPIAATAFSRPNRPGTSTRARAASAG